MAVVVVVVVVEGVTAAVDGREILERIDARLLGFMGAWNGVLAFSFFSLYFISLFPFGMGGILTIFGVVNCGS